MSSIQFLHPQVIDIERCLGFPFKDRELLSRAFIHRSFTNEHRYLAEHHNERLEFLGDAVLGLIVADLLHRKFAEYEEGTLTQVRSRLVDASACAKYLQKVRLVEYILLGKGEKTQNGLPKGSICADVFEAIIGAIYLDQGYEFVTKWLQSTCAEEIQAIIGNPRTNYKAELQDYSQKKFQKTPLYRVVEEKGPDHAKIFVVVVSIQEKDLGTGQGSTKKEAEQEAAQEALVKLQVSPL